MVLDVKKLINTPGERIDFSFDEDLSDVDFGGVCPADRPVSVVGQVRNAAGMIALQMSLDTELSAVCARCASPFVLPLHAEYECMLAEQLESEEENDDIRLLDNDKVDLSELAREVFILNMPTKTLCREDCKGLCSGCGADLNFKTCRCKKEIDPRLQILADLLEK